MKISNYRMLSRLCDLADASGSPLLHDPARLASCQVLIADGEQASHTWDGSSASLLRALVRLPLLSLRTLELKNLQMDAAMLGRIGEILGDSRMVGPDHCRPSRHALSNRSGVPLLRAPHLGHLVLDDNGLRAADMPALTRALAALPSLHALTLRANLIGDDGALSLHELWPYHHRNLRHLALDDGGVAALGFDALVGLAERSASGCLRGRRDRSFSLDRALATDVGANAGLHAARKDPLLQSPTRVRSRCDGLCCCFNLSVTRNQDFDLRRLAMRPPARIGGHWVRRNRAPSRRFVLGLAQSGCHASGQTLRPRP